MKNNRLCMVFLITLFLPAYTYADKRDLDDVMKIANNHWQKVCYSKSAIGVGDTDTTISCVELDSLCFVVSRKSGINSHLSGYVIVSADTSMPEVLAFDDSASFTPDNLPESIKSWLEDYKYMQTMSEQDSQAVKAWLESSQTGNDDVSPLLGNIEWNQGNPYNALCPEMDGEKTPTGCVATALSQIMKYHRWPAHGKGSIDYYTTTNNFHITKDFGNTVFDWDKMRDQYDDNVTDNSVIMPVATLLSAVGAAVRMNYDTNGSGTNDANTYYGMRNYIGYDSDMFLADAEDFSSEQWQSTLQNELLEGRPVYYTGQSGRDGHAFVIDGMQKDADGTMYYHINWGWGGLCNGSYLLNMLKPKEVGTGATMGADFSNNNSMICGMMPEDNITHRRMICKNIGLVTTSYLPEQIMQVCIESLVPLSDEINADVTLTLTSKENPSENYEVFFAKNQTFNAKSKWSNYYLSYYIPKKLSAGKYELKLKCTDTSEENIELLVNNPEVEILSDSVWYGGKSTSPKECFGISGEDTSMLFDGDGGISMTIDSLINLSERTNSGEMAFAVTDTVGKLLSVMEKKTNISLSGSSVLRNKSINGTFSRNMPDGDYRLCLGYKPSSDDRWTYLYKMSFTESLWMSKLTLFSIPFSVADGKISIAGNVFSGADTPWLQTGIPVISEDNTSASVIYNVLGQKVGNSSPYSIYLTNGRKIINKHH